MPLSKAEKDLKIDNLRKRSDYSLIVSYVVPAGNTALPMKMVEHNGHPEGRLYFPDLVEYDVKEIVSKGLNKGVIGWGTRCKEIREKKKHTPQEAADIIQISRSSLQDEENKVEETNVDPFYLEAFALLYNESPYTLLGLKPPIIDPLRTVDDSLSMYMNTIITSLYIENDPEKVEFMKVITKIATLSDDMQRKLVDFLKSNTKLFTEVFKQNVLKTPAAKDGSWRGKMIERVLIKDLSPEANARRNLYVNLLSALQHLENRRSPRLEELAQLVALDEATARKARSVLSAIIVDAGFPRAEEKSVRSDIDSILKPLNLREDGK